jgi:hypothetical protein
MLQLGSGKYGTESAREVDPIFTGGLAYRRGLWNLVISDTLITYFRPQQSTSSTLPAHNASVVADIELNHPLCKQLPSVISFARLEQVWNAGADKLPGMSGTDFRLYTGLRFMVNKPSYLGAMERARKELSTSSIATAATLRQERHLCHEDGKQEQKASVNAAKLSDVQIASASVPSAQNADSDQVQF